MTSNERKIIKCLWDEKGKTRVQTIAQRTGFSSDYTRLLCRSLERGEYLKFVDANVCCLLTKGRNRFQGSDPIVTTAQHDSTVNAEPVVVSISERDKDSSKDDTSDNEPDNSGEEMEEAKPEEQTLGIKKEVNKENVEAEEKVKAEQKEKTGEDALKNLGDASRDEKEKLASAGYKTVEDLAEAPVSRLIQSIGVNLKKAADWINQARRQTGAMHDKKVKSKK